MKYIHSLIGATFKTIFILIVMNIIILIMAAGIVCKLIKEKLLWK